MKKNKMQNAEGPDAARMDAAAGTEQPQEYYDPGAEPEAQAATASKRERKPKARRGLGTRLIAACSALICIFSMTTSAWYFNDYMLSTATKRSLPTVTRSLAHNMQKISYAPAISYALRLEASSVELDLGVTILDEYNAIVTGYPFEVRITQQGVEDAEPVLMTDEDLDGQLYFDELEAGDYLVELTKAEGYLMPDPVTVTVLPQVTYEWIDVSDKVVSSDEIDASQDDPQYGGNHAGSGGSGSTTTTPSTDTVEYVESSTRTETRTSTVDKVVNGVQVYAYKPAVSANGLLLFTDGTESDLIAVLDENGYLIKGQRAVDDGVPEGTVPPEGSAETPQEGATETTPSGDAGAAQSTPPAETPVSGDPNNAAGVGGTTYVDVQLIDSSYNLMTDPTTGKTFQAEKIKVTETITETVTIYYGWQVLDGKTYYFDKNGNKVTGWQTILGVTYFFNNDGARGGSAGIDVSTWQDDIDWAKVKASGVDFVFVRLGFRGYGSGKLVLDNMYHRHMQGALAAGLKVGVYFFTQAINAQEAVEEASMCLQYVSGYNISYPIAIDIEWAASNARTNSLTNAQRTEICRAFCETIRNAGYTPCVYANKNYFTTMLNTSQLEQYVIWLAHYTDQTNYSRRYDIWQYTSTASVPGVSGGVDMNISYLGY